MNHLFKHMLIVLVILAMLIPLQPAKVALAYTITVDASSSDWSLTAPAQNNLGHIARNSEEKGEYIWKDAPGDESTFYSIPDPAGDILEFRVTADASYLYFMVKMNNITTGVGYGAPMIQIAIDTNQAPGNGQIWFLGIADTRIDATAAWEYLVMTRFGSGSLIPWVYDFNYTEQAGGNSTNASSTISNANETIEIRVSWATIGYAEPPTSPLQISVASFHADGDDNALDNASGSDAVDVISNYGNPGSTNDTWDEVGVDAILDYFFSVWFERDGDPYPPLLVSEFQPNTPGIDTDEEWVEFFNNAPVLLDLTNYKLGDEETIDGIEGMYNFPGGSTISPGKAQVVAQKGTGFNALFGFLPEYELTETSAAGNMLIDTLWASGTIALANAGDEVLLLDSHDTILDVAVYGSADTYPGVIAIPFVDNEQSVERRPVWHDTNDCSVDFRRQVDPSPGVVYLYGFFLPLAIKP